MTEVALGELSSVLAASLRSEDTGNTDMSRLMPTHVSVASATRTASAIRAEAFSNPLAEALRQFGRTSMQGQRNSPADGSTR